MSPEIGGHLLGALKDEGRVAQHVAGRGLELARRQAQPAPLVVVRQHHHLRRTLSKYESW